MNKSFKLSSQDERERCINYLNSLNLDKPLSVEIKLYRKNRTLAQNRLLFMWLTIIGNDLGYHVEEIHAIMKDKFLSSEIVVFQGKGFQVSPSTANLNTKEFTEYLNRIELFANSELGIILPHPEEIYWEAMGIKG